MPALRAFCAIPRNHAFYAIIGLAIGHLEDYETGVACCVLRIRHIVQLVPDCQIRPSGDLIIPSEPCVVRGEDFATTTNTQYATRNTKRYIKVFRTLWDNN